MTLLVIGTLPPPIGGTTVLLQGLVKSLRERHEVQLRILDTVGISGAGFRGLCRGVRLLHRLCGAIRTVDVVSLHCCSTTTLPIVGSIVLLLARLLDKPFLIRKFAGDDYRVTLGVFWAWIGEFVLRHSDLYLAETRHLVEQAVARGFDNVRWFPTSRGLGTVARDSDRKATQGECRRFVYVGHVRRCKGVYKLAEAARGLPAGVTIDVYGAWFEDVDRHVFADSPNIRYLGELKPEEVVDVMRQYDAAVLPTIAPTEGYPGMVLESYLAGLPVVASRIGGIPEIVDDSVGILVEPDNADDLCEAMTCLTQDHGLFQRLRSNTSHKAEFFSNDRWAEYFVSLCREVCCRRME